MQWGLDGIQLSYDYLALSFNSALADAFTANKKPHYDYYVSKHDSNASGPAPPPTSPASATKKKPGWLAKAVALESHMIMRSSSKGSRY